MVPAVALGFQDITAVYHLLPSSCTLDLPQPALENMEVAQRAEEPTPSFPRVGALGQSLSDSVVKTACLHFLDSMDIARGTLMNSLGSRPILSCTIMQQQPQLLIIIRDSELWRCRHSFLDLLRKREFGGTFTVSSGRSLPVATGPSTFLLSDLN